MAIIVRGMPESRDTELRSRLSRAGVRPTRQRITVLKALAAEEHDATAQEIYARLRRRGERVGLATVYRTLSLLSEREVVDELAHRPSEMCYRVCSPGHHHHLVCSECHRVEELGSCDLEPWLDRAAGSRGFLPTSHTLEVVGLCAGCRPV
jgi:Fur family transcriptional regulator, ferric uptake regulator